MDTVKYGIIGVGNMGSAHWGFFNQGKIPCGIVTAVADIEPLRLEAIVKKGFDGQCYGSGNELIDKADIDAVIIATPHYSHPIFAVKAFERGLNVICEKPAGVYTKQVKEMNAAADASGKLFAMMFNQRTNPLYIKMREYVAGGYIGSIKRINWQITNWYRSQAYYDSGSWRATWAGEGGGVLFNQCPHQLDLLQWITGLMPSKVHAFCKFGKWHDIEVEDDVTAYLEYGDGATGVFVTSTADWPGTNRFEITGTLGKLVCENGKLSFWRLDQDEREFNKINKEIWAAPKISFEEFVPTEESPEHVGILTNFTDAVLGKDKLFVDGREGLKSVELMDAMLLSQWLDKAIEMPFDDEMYLSELNKRVETSKIKKTGQNRIVTKMDGTFGKV